MNVDNIHWLGHASFRIQDGATVIYIDPWKLSGNPAKADVVLITHRHYDHFSPDDIAKVAKEGTVFVATRDVAENLGKEKVLTVKAGDSVQAGPLTVEAIPAYNLNKQFHPKADGGVGYIVTLSNGERIYHSGDSDEIPEMKGVKADVALMPCGGTYTMTASEMADAANSFRPGVLIPMHWGDIVGSKADAETVAKNFKGQTVIKEIEK